MGFCSALHGDRQWSYTKFIYFLRISYWQHIYIWYSLSVRGIDLKGSNQSAINKHGHTSIISKYCKKCVNVYVPCRNLQLTPASVSETTVEHHHMLTHSRWKSWWRHQMKTFSALLVICAGNSAVSVEVPAQRPVTRSFAVFSSAFE